MRAFTALVWAAGFAGLAAADTAKVEDAKQIEGTWRLVRGEQDGRKLAADVLKCQLKPIDAKDYAVTFSADERARLSAIFPGGVCDWSKPGVNQTPVVAWASFGPSPKNLVFDVTK